MCMYVYAHTGESQPTVNFEAYNPRIQDRLTVLKIVVNGKWSMYLCMYLSIFLASYSHHSSINQSIYLSTEEGRLNFVYGVCQQYGGPIISLDGGAVDDDRWIHVAVTFEQR